MGVGCFDGSGSDQAGLFLSLRGLADGWSRSGACRMTAPLVPPRRRRFRRLRFRRLQDNRTRGHSNLTAAGLTCPFI